MGRIFHGNSALELWDAAPDPLRGQAGSPRKLAEAKMAPKTPEGRWFPGNPELRLRAAVPGPLTWTGQNPAESR